MMFKRKKQEVLLLVLLSISLAGPLRSQVDPQACPDQLQVNLDSTGGFWLGPAQIAPMLTSSDWSVIVVDDNPADGSQIYCVGDYDYGLFNEDEILVCRGIVSVTDVSPPSVALNDKAYAIPLSCHYLDLLVENDASVFPGVNQYIGRVEFTDNSGNCGCEVNTTYTDQVVYQPCPVTISWGESYIVAILYRTWVAVDCFGNQREVTQEFLFKRPALQDLQAGNPVQRYHICDAEAQLLPCTKPFWLGELGDSLYLEDMVCQYDWQVAREHYTSCGGLRQRSLCRYRVLDHCTGTTGNLFDGEALVTEWGDFSAPQLTGPVEPVESPTDFDQRTSLGADTIEIRPPQGYSLNLLSLDTSGLAPGDEVFFTLQGDWQDVQEISLYEHLGFRFTKVMELSWDQTGNGSLQLTEKLLDLAQLSELGLYVKSSNLSEVSAYCTFWMFGQNTTRPVPRFTLYTTGLDCEANLSTRLADLQDEMGIQVSDCALANVLTRLWQYRPVATGGFYTGDSLWQELGPPDESGIIRALTSGLYALALNAIDACGQATQGLVYFDVKDGSAPMLSCLPEATVNLADADMGSWPADAFVASIQDNCGAFQLEIRRVEATGTAQPWSTELTLFCRDTQMDSLQVEVRAIDDNGLESKCQISLKVQADSACDDTQDIASNRDNFRIAKGNLPDGVPSKDRVTSLYPNPFTDALSLRLYPGWQASAPVEVVLYDMLGRQLQAWHWTCNDMPPELQLQPRVDLLPGIYLLRVKGKGWQECFSLTHQ